MHRAISTLLLAVLAASDAHASLSSGADTFLESQGQVESLLVAQHGRVVVERHRRAGDAMRAHPLRSAGKSLISAALGIAFGGERLQFVDAGVLEVLQHARLVAHANGEKASITIRDVLTMRSGLQCPAEADRRNVCDPAQARTRFPWREYLQLPLADEPGTAFAYNDANPVVIRTLVYAITGTQADDVLAEHVFAPLGMDRSASIGKMRPIDMLRFGQLYLQGGCWDGAQRIPRAWVEQSTSPQVDLSRGERRAGYGYFWWWLQTPVDGAPVDVAYAGGNGGQLIMIVPARDAVIVTTGNAYDRLDVLREQIRAVLRDLLPRLAADEASTAAACGVLK